MSLNKFVKQIGMASALETLCGQAYGARQYHTLGLHTYRAIVTLLVVCVPLSLLWAFMGKILALIGQDPLIAHGAGRYIVWLIPGLFANAVIQPITKFLQSQSLTTPLLLSSVATLALHVPLCWVMVFRTGMGYTGAALAISVSYWLNVAMLVAYIVMSSSCKETRTPPTIKACRGVGVFLRLALPSALMICLEWWSFELLILMSGLLPNPELQTSVLSICTRVANELGAGNPEGARSAVRVVMSVAVTEAVIVSGALLLSRRLLGRAYSSEEEVASAVAAMVPLVCITVVTDGLQGVLSGVARGCGWQHVGAYVNLGSFYLLGIPMALILGFVLKMGAKGLWMGVVCGSISQTTLLSAITFFTNWRKMHRSSVIKELLTLIGNVSGMCTSYNKCSATPIQCYDDQVITFTASIACPIAHLPMEYLDLPLSIRKPSDIDLLLLVDKLEKKLSTWRASMLSLGHRLALVRHVICAMPTHLLVAIVLNKTILAMVNQIIHGFLWAGRKDAKGGRCKINWAKEIQDEACLWAKAGAKGMINLLPAT
ncbi:unnamed protein product [Triticum turgidum subsp. durum]|uniref:Protein DETOXIFICATION n=1 Tax=Triticum turgidum subsp. durum TaxID=4567 RepID=A0A9R0VMW4_TRITD|nr:unnamed protein product [Triticum turgidum subsp. durum]